MRAVKILSKECADIWEVELQKIGAGEQRAEAGHGMA